MLLVLTLSAAKSNVSATAAAVGSKRSRSRPKKSSEVERRNSEAESEEKRNDKTRSTSRGMFNRIKVKKDESETKNAAHEADKDETKLEEENKIEDASVPAGAVAGLVGAAPTEASSSGMLNELLSVVLSIC